MVTYLPAPPDMGFTCDEGESHPATHFLILDGFWDGVCVCEDGDHRVWAEIFADVRDPCSDDPPWPEEKVREELGI